MAVLSQASRLCILTVKRTLGNHGMWFPRRVCFSVYACGRDCACTYACVPGCVEALLGFHVTHYFVCAREPVVGAPTVTLCRKDARLQCYDNDLTIAAWISIVQGCFSEVSDSKLSGFLVVGPLKIWKVMTLNMPPTSQPVTLDYWISVNACRSVLTKRGMPHNHGHFKFFNPFSDRPTSMEI